MDADQNDSLELVRLRKEVWEKAVDTQMHFNEMSVKSRQLGLSLVVAALGLAVVLLTREQTFLLTIPVPLFGIAATTHVSAIVVLIAAGGLYAVKVLDLGVYHRMLRGAVSFGEELEKAKFRESLMRTRHGMTELISMFSRYAVVDSETHADGSVEFKGKPCSKRTAEQKITRFYRITIFVLLAIGMILLLSFGGIQPAEKNVPAHVTQGQPGPQQ